MARSGDFPRWLRILLLILAVIRLMVASHAPLSADECYYWVWSKALAAGYLDHPPMVAVWIRVGTFLAGDTPLGVRLLGPVSALLGTLLLMRAAEDLWPQRRAGIVAACLLNATLALNVGAVVITPDTPLLFFWTAALACLARLIRTENANWWLAFGVCAGLAMDSKYTGALLIAAVGLWVIAVPTARRWLRCRQLWAGLLLAALCLMPVIFWNASHGYASLLKQGGRAGDWNPTNSLRYLAEFVGSQIGLATPLVAWLFARGAIFAAREARREQRAAFLACVTLAPACVFLQHALGDRVQANWPAIIFPGAALAAAGLAERSLWRSASGLGFALALAVFLQAAAAPFALPRWADFSLIRLAGWSDLAGYVFVAETRENAAFVAADEYGLASELAFRLHGEVVGTEVRWAMFNLPKTDLGGRTGVLVRSDREYGGPDQLLWSGIVSLGSLVRQRHGVVAETYHLFSVTARPGISVAILPNRKNLPRS